MQCDLASEGFLGNINQLDEYCREKGFHAWFETSAKENIGIDEAARSLVAKVCPSETCSGVVLLLLRIETYSSVVLLLLRIETYSSVVFFITDCPNMATPW